VHDPLVVAFTVRRPWPSRSSLPATGTRADGVRWRIRLNHQHTAYCREHDPPHPDGPFPWWRPSSYLSHWRLAGRDYWWPPLLTVWHAEPGGRDSGEVCRHYTRTRQADGTYTTRRHRAWRWHVHHWQIQVHPWQAARRWLLTRCAWCGGPSRKHDPVNISRQQDAPRSPWRKGEPGLYHHGCDTVASAHETCHCDDPLTERGDYGRCALCGKYRPYRHTPSEADHILSALPPGSRLTDDLRARCEPAWQAARLAALTADPALDG